MNSGCLVRQSVLTSKRETFNPKERIAQKKVKMKAFPIRTASILLVLLVLHGLFGLRPASSQLNLLYNLVPLATQTGEDISLARDISISGQVAGRSGHLTGSNTRAVLWSLAGKNNIGTLPNGDYSGAFGVNNFGQVVGTSNTASVTRAFIWTSTSGIQDLGTLPQDSCSEAFGINNSGVVVGTSSGSKGIRAVLWKSARIKNLGTLPGGTNSRASAINDSGQVVGTSSSPSGNRAVLWSENGNIQNLGTLPGDTSSEARDINNSGQVVGYSTGPNGTRAFVWSSSGQMQALGALPGGVDSRAFGINNLGVIVGTSSTPNGPHAVIWTSIGVTLDLNTLISGLSPDLVIVEAHCINDLGLIAAVSGGGIHSPISPGDDHGDEAEHFYRAFLLTPIQSGGNRSGGALVESAKAPRSNSL